MTPFEGIRRGDGHVSPYQILIRFSQRYRVQRKPLHRCTVNLLLQKYSVAASLPLHAHPHMLRHACGYAQADEGADTRLIQDYLGHRNIQHTVRYTASNPARFQKLW